MPNNGQPLSTLIINEIESREVYEKMVEQGKINPYELYLITDSEPMFGIDDKPTAGSKNLVYSNGIYEAIQEVAKNATFEETDPTVPDWAKAETKPTYTAEEVGALPDTTVIPTKTSELINDSGYISSLQDVSGKLDSDGDGSNLSINFTASDTRTNLTSGEKINTSFGKITKWFSDLGNLAFKTIISKNDLDLAIQSSLSKADTALQNFEELDPTVPTWAKSATKPVYTAEEVGADAVGTAERLVGVHNTDSEAHNDVRLLISALDTRLSTLANSDDTTLDQMAEIVAYIKANRTLIESVTTSKVNTTDIIDNLTTNVANKPLSAAQGVVLKNLIDEVNGSIGDISTTLDSINGEVI